MFGEMNLMNLNTEDDSKIRNQQILKNMSDL